MNRLVLQLFQQNVINTQTGIHYSLEWKENILTHESM
jgi:hypothetical protein